MRIYDASGRPVVSQAGGGGGGGGGVALSAGTQLGSTGTIVLSDSNGMSFGMSGSTRVTGSFQAIKSVSAGTTRVTGGELVLSNLNGLSFGADGQTITGSYTVPAVPPETPFGVSAGTQSVSTGTLIFSDSNGLSFGMSGSSRVTGSFAALKSLSAGTTRVTNGEMVFSNSHGMSFGVNGQTVTGSHNGLTTQSVQTQSVIASISAGTTRVTSGELVFSNSNGVSFGIDGQTITATVVPGAAAGIAALAAGTQTATSGTVVFSDSNGMSFGLSGSTRLTGTFHALKSVSAGTTRVTEQELILSDSNGISFGANGGTITAKMPEVSLWDLQQAFYASNAVAGGTASAQRILVPFRIRATRADLVAHLTGSSSGAASWALHVGLYTMSGSTASLASSAERLISYNSTSAQSYTNHSGTRHRSISLGTFDVTPGDYLLVVLVNSTSASTNSTLTLYGRSSLSMLAEGTAGGNMSQYFGNGIASVSSSALPNSYHLSNFNYTGGSVNRQPFVRLVGSF